MKIDVILLPKETAALDLSDSVCIVLDIFRATTTIVTALANGCKTITPALSIEDAQTLASKMGSVLFAGERQSIKIEGYEFGNSPFEFCKEKVTGRDIVMTTTNGTIAIKAAEKAYRTFIGSFVNAKAVCMQTKQYGKDIVIVCAGTDGLFSLEDTLCAGLLVQLLKAECEVTLSDSALGALLLYAQAKDTLVETAVQSRNGKRLYDLRRMDDVEYCLSADLFTIVPQYIEGKIVIENQ
ncbi:2-phosphosulfolactate phosphatase [Pelosinus baikalensis]|uniref:Probable 2-phosphosulfolactate phosphatase n=1 Tax=Pelosinus baikalensis TaxID=2892015 RepID=A0ABS8HZ32_9FIRM|nr:2-phosphosulfolactate phosphatase [Pelosinus baikalensis]MCC5468222.1 2-phosphosulfolactate phosphatase [Pelosinus baikalensis]